MFRQLNYNASTIFEYKQIRLVRLASTFRIGSQSTASPANRIFVGEKSLIQQHLSKLSILSSLGKETPTVSIHNQDGSKTTVCTFENKLSRNLGLIRSDLIQAAIKSNIVPGVTQVTLVVPTKEAAVVAALSLAHLFPIYDRKSKPKTFNVCVDFLGVSVDTKEVQAVADGIRQTQRFMDTPCEDFRVSTFVQEARDLVARLANPTVEIKVIEGEALKEQGFGGIYGVGKGASVGPAFVVLSYVPESATKSIALVGKGIVYDTGGLSIKSTANMCAMKFDKVRRTIYTRVELVPFYQPLNCW